MRCRHQVDGNQRRKKRKITDTSLFLGQNILTAAVCTHFPLGSFHPHEQQQQRHGRLCSESSTNNQTSSVRKINPHLPANIEAEIQTRLTDISALLAAIAPEVQGINRYRYARNMSCIEELIEALTFAHYLRTQSLMGYGASVDQVAALYDTARLPPPAADKMDVVAEEKAAAAAAAEAEAEAHLPVVLVTEQDYLMGIFDLSGEMMRFATTSAALNGSLDGPAARTIVADMQELGSVFEMLPQQYGKSYSMKLETLRQSVLKVEKLGYGLKVRGSERPAGWMPDTADDGFGREE